MKVDNWLINLHQLFINPNQLLLKDPVPVKKVFFLSVFLLVLFEIANVYFIMPMPGSQGMNSIGLAYFFYSWRWIFRIGLGIVALFSLWQSRFKRPWGPAIALLIWGCITYSFNFQMTAERMFIQPELVMKATEENEVALKRLVIGVSHNGEASAYPIQFMAYHHQVRDVVGGQPVMVTYCNVCRTGRVFEPKIAGRNENFRLVGMNHFNAMFEDASTKSWWRQENGEAIAGPLKGQVLPEMACAQMTLKQWLKYHPNSKVMQADSTYAGEYKHQRNFENGNKKGKLTRTDTLSWKDKSWVVGINIGKVSKAFDWNVLKEKGIINDQVGDTPILLALAKDGKSFMAFERPNGKKFSLKNDTLSTSTDRYNWLGKSLNPSTPDLKNVAAYQEFWHSWKTFHGDAR